MDEHDAYPDGMSTRDVIVDYLNRGRMVLREDAQLLIDAAIREETSAEGASTRKGGDGGHGPSWKHPDPSNRGAGAANTGAPSSDLERVLVRVFTALFPPTSEGPGGVIDYTDLPEHVRAVVRERDGLKAEVSKWALRAHKAGVPVALDHETGTWSIHEGDGT